MGVPVHPSVFSVWEQSRGQFLTNPRCIKYERAIGHRVWLPAGATKGCHTLSRVSFVVVLKEELSVFVPG
jgi:hypothetical protein